MRNAIYHTQAALFCLGVLLLLSHGFINRLSWAVQSDGALVRRSYPPELSNLGLAVETRVSSREAGGETTQAKSGKFLASRQDSDDPEEEEEEEDPITEEEERQLRQQRFPEIWAKAFTRGDVAYGCYLPVPAVDAPENWQSSVTDFATLDQDYQENPNPLVSTADLATTKFQMIDYIEAGLRADGGWQALSLVPKNGILDVWWENMYNPNRGIIIAASNENTGLGDDNTIKVRKSSDVFFLTWDRVTGGDEERRRGLRYVVQHNVVNEDTYDIIAALVITGEGTRISNGGTEFTPTNHLDMFKRLLGSPLGTGVAYLLLQHKPQLGAKTVSRIRLYPMPPPEANEPEPAEPNPYAMVFDLEDIPDPEEGDEMVVDG